MCAKCGHSVPNGIPYPSKMHCTGSSQERARNQFTMSALWWYNEEVIASHRFREFSALGQGFAPSFSVSDNVDTAMAVRALRDFGMTEEEIAVWCLSRYLLRRVLIVSHAHDALFLIGDDAAPRFDTNAPELKVQRIPCAPGSPTLRILRHGAHGSRGAIRRRCPLCRLSKRPGLRPGRTAAARPRTRCNSTSCAESCADFSA